MACYSTCTAIILRQSQDKYFGYGKDRDTANNVPTDHKFTGQKQDGSGLMYYASRYYDPQTGLFVSPDTIVPDAGLAVDYNRFMYTRGNSLKYNDPSGHTVAKFNCLYCNQTWFSYPDTSETLDIDLAVSAFCFFAGCHVDWETNTVTGPTEQEAIAMQKANLVSLAMPIGMVETSLADAALSSKTVRVFRVEGAKNTRISILEGGLVKVSNKAKMLFLNFGDEQHAADWFEKRVAQGMDGVSIKSFEVPKEFLDYIRQIAVPEELAREFPNSPIVVDITKAADQYGLRPEQIDQLIEMIIQGTGQTQ